MNATSITALIIAVTGLATAVPAIIYALKSHGTATAAQMTADRAREELADHRTGDH